MRDDEVFCTHCGHVGQPGRAFVHLGGGVYVCQDNGACTDRAAVKSTADSETKEGGQA